MKKKRSIMKLTRIKRNTRNEKRYNSKMGILYTRVTYIKEVILGIPIRTLHKYRETYYGEIKDCSECNLAT
tara:strand:- start:6272 stop:6484 length:213 start_codon:yes stop_codon:yes gene_type:complete